MKKIIYTLKIYYYVAKIMIYENNYLSNYIYVLWTQRSKHWSNDNNKKIGIRTAKDVKNTRWDLF